MKLPDNITPRLLALLGTPACLLAFGTPLVRAQVAPAPVADAATLAKYDANRNGKLDPNELVALEAAQKAAASAPTDTAARPGQEEVVALSPFEVTSDSNRGYFQSNTMSGTRLNSKIEDLGQSITVMTKEQMTDFAMLDINDVFDHMASTEGTNSYSDFVTDRTGAVVDNVSLDPEQRQSRARHRQRQHRVQQHRDHRPRARRSAVDGFARAEPRSERQHLRLGQRVRHRESGARPPPT
jgi:hypothetical protein